MNNQERLNLSTNFSKQNYNLFTKYLREKNIKLNKKEIESVFCFFDNIRGKNLFVEENVKFYKKQTKFSDLAKNKLREYIEIFEKSKKTGNPEGKRLIDFLGNEYKGYKDLEAINKLLEIGEGYIPDALERDYFGKITLLWGHQFLGGLAHIISRRKIDDKMSYEEVESFLRNIPDIIKTGKIKFNTDTERYEFSKNKKVLVVDILTEDTGVKFLLSGFKMYQKQKSN